MPVFSTHLLDYEGLAVGRRIRDHRFARSYTLRDLAGKIGISEAKLSNVERGKVSLDLDELAQIAAALEQPLHAFLPRETVRHYFIRSRDDLARNAPIARELIGPEAGPASHH
ncbi:MAG: helix-turn-helix domain-containing protein, partial [Geminicoccales bacterium]